jgi:hypothetical protein
MRRIAFSTIAILLTAQASIARPFTTKDGILYVMENKSLVLAMNMTMYIVMCDLNSAERRVTSNIREAALEKAGRELKEIPALLETPVTEASGSLAYNLVSNGHRQESCNGHRKWLRSL